MIIYILLLIFLFDCYYYDLNKHNPEGKKNLAFNFIDEHFNIVYGISLTL